MRLDAIDTVFLDRDGTLIEDRHYLCHPDGVCLVPGVAPAMAELGRLGVRFFLVSNQSGIGRGRFTFQDLLQVQSRLDELLGVHGAHITDWAACPHAPQESCTCRKPERGLWDILAQRHQIDPGRTLMVGDKASDIIFGQRLGCLTALVRTGHGEDQAQALGLPELCQDPMPLPPHPSWPHLQASSLTVLLQTLLASRRKP